MKLDFVSLKRLQTEAQYYLEALQEKEVVNTGPLLKKATKHMEKVVKLMGEATKYEAIFNPREEEE